MPRHQRAPVVPDHDGPLGTDVVEQGRDVIGEVVDPVVTDVARPRRRAVAALIGREHVPSGRRQRDELVTPRPRRLGEAVQEDDDGTARDTGLRHVQLHPVGHPDPAVAHARRPALGHRVTR